MNKISATTNIGMAQINVKRGDIDANLKTHYAVIDEAHKHSVDVLIFPELSLTGYEPDLAQSLAIEVNSNILDDLKAKAIRYNMTIMVGAPKLTNTDQPLVALFIIDNSGVVTTYSKMYLHPGEDAYFSRGDLLCQRTINNLNYSLAICADTSNEQHIIDSITPQSKFYLASALISHAVYESDSLRLREYACKYNLIVGLSNFIGESGSYTCAGKSGFYNHDGSILTQLPSNVTGIAIATYHNDGILLGKSIIISRQAQVD